MSLFSMAKSTVYIRVALLYPFILRWNPGCFQIFAAVSNAAVTKARGWPCNAGHSPGARDVGIRGTERASAGRRALPGYAALPPGTARPEAVGKGPREARVAAEQWRVGAGSADLTVHRTQPPANAAGRQTPPSGRETKPHSLPQDTGSLITATPPPEAGGR